MNIHFTRSSVNTFLYILGLLFYSQFLHAQAPILTYSGPTQFDAGAEPDCRADLDIDQSFFSDQPGSSSLVTNKDVLSIVDQFGNAYGQDPDVLQFGPDTTITISYSVDYRPEGSASELNTTVSFMFAFVDETSPDITAGPPADIVNTNRIDHTGLIPKGFATAMDQCAGVLVADSSYAFDYNPAGYGIVTRTWNFVDDYGNSESVSQIIEVSHPELDFLQKDDKTMSLDTLPDDPNIYLTTIPDFSPVALLRMAYDGTIGDSILAFNNIDLGIASHIDDVDTSLINAALNVTIEDDSDGLCPTILVRHYIFEDRMTGDRDTLSRRYELDDNTSPTANTVNFNGSTGDCNVLSDEESFVQWAMDILANENETYFSDNSPNDLFIRIYETDENASTPGVYITDSRRNIDVSTTENLIRQDLEAYYNNLDFVCGGDTTFHFFITYNDFCEELAGLRDTVMATFEVRHLDPIFNANTPTNTVYTNNCDVIGYENAFVNWVNDITNLEHIDLFCTPQDSYQIVLFLDLDDDGVFSMEEDTEENTYLLFGRDANDTEEIRPILDTLNKRVSEAIQNRTCTNQVLDSLGVFFLVETFDCPRNTADFYGANTDASFIHRVFGVRDAVAPTWITDPQDTTVYVCGINELNAPFQAWRNQMGGATYTAGCTEVTTSSTPVMFPTTIAGPGEIQVTFSITDDCGNTSSRVASFFYQDTTLAFRPDGLATNRVVQCRNASDNLVDLANWLNENGDAANVFDCGDNITTWNNFNSNNFTSNGCDTNYTVTFYFEDPSGNIDSTTGTFSIRDTLPPFFLLSFDNLNSTVSAFQTEGQLNDTLANWEANFTTAILKDDYITDDCHPDMVEVVQTQRFEIERNNCGSSRFYGMHVEITDGCGHNAVDTAYFSIVDSEGPRWLDTTGVMDITVECDGDSNHVDLNRWIDQNLNAEFLEIEDTDSLVAQRVQTLFDGNGCFVGYTYRFFAQDDCGNNSDTLYREFMVEDNLDPVITLDGRTVGDTLIINCHEPLPATPTATFNDRCDATRTILLNSRTFVADPFGVNSCDQDTLYTYTWIASDCAGNTTTANWYVLKEDLTPPNPGVVDTFVNCETIVQADLDNWMDFYTKMQDNCLPQDEINVLVARYRTHDEGNTSAWVDLTGPTYSDNTPTLPNTQADKYWVELDLELSDDCGNIMRDTLRFTVQDTIAPGIMATDRNNFKDTIFLSLQSLPNEILDLEPTLNGVVDSFAYNDGPAGTNIADQCFNNDKPYIITYTDIFDRDFYCGGGYLLKRVWSVTDVAMNTLIDTQYIAVQDVTPPSFNISDIQVNCANGTEPEATGYPTDIYDFGGITVTDTINGTGDAIGVLYYRDSITGNQTTECAYDLRRIWRLIDSCENVYSHIQDIEVRDETGPAIVSVPDTLKYYCNSNVPPEAMFNDWVASLGQDANGVSLVAEDACDPTISNEGGVLQADGQIGNSSWYAFHAGNPMTDERADFVIERASNDLCGAYHIEIDFVVVDRCGNQTTQQLVFSVLDTIAPVFQQEPENKSYFLDANCDLNAFIGRSEIPTAIDACQNRTILIDESTDVNDEITTTDRLIEFTNPVGTTDYLALGDVRVDYQLENVDGEQPNEYLLIRDGLGNLLGRTPNVSTQGGDITGTLLIPAEIYNANVIGGAGITLRFTPLEEDDENETVEFATLTEARFRFSAQPLNLVTYSYQINDEPVEELDETGILLDDLALGTHQVTVYAEDCVGNVSMTRFNVTIGDATPPVVMWPEITDSIQGIADCQSAELTISTPVYIEDCGPVSYDFDTGLRNILFDEAPNQDAYILQQDTFSVPVDVLRYNPVGDAVLTIYAIGDFDMSQNFEELEVVLEDNSKLTINTFQSSCDGVETVFEATIDSIDVVRFAQDGLIKFVVQNVQRSGVSRDGNWSDDDPGVTPCSYANFPADGGSIENALWDGVSQWGLDFSYPINAAYYTVYGATDIPRTKYPESGKDTTLILNSGTNYLNWEYVDASGNITRHIDTIVVGDGTNVFTDAEFLLSSTEAGCAGDEVILTFKRPDNFFHNDPSFDPVYYLYQDVSFGDGAYTLVDSFVQTENPVSFEYTYTTPNADRVRLFYVVKEGGCTSAESNIDTIQMIRLPQPQLEILYDRAADGTILSATLLVVNADGLFFNGNESFVWKKGEEILAEGTKQFESSLVIQNPDMADEGAYTFEFTGINGCTVSSSVPLILNQELIYAFADTPVDSNVQFIVDAQDSTEAYLTALENWLASNNTLTNVSTNGNPDDLQIVYFIDTDNDGVLDAEEFSRVASDSLNQLLQRRLDAAIASMSCTNNSLASLPIFYVVEEKQAPFTAPVEIAANQIALATFSVVDTIAPVWTAAPVREEFIGCSEGIQAAYDAWLANLGGGIATDNIGFTITSSTTGTLPDTIQTMDSIEVVFTATDYCGNASMQSAYFVTAPAASMMPEVVLDTVANCSSMYTLAVASQCQQYVWVPEGKTVAEAQADPALVTTEGSLQVTPDFADYGVSSWTVYCSDAANECLSQGTPITILDLSTVTLTVTENVEACSGDSIALTAAVNDTNSYAYTWITPNGSEVNGAMLELNNISQADNGRYTLRATNDYGCMLTASTTVNVIDSLVLDTIDSYAGCAGQNFSLAAPMIEGATYVWSRILENDGVFQVGNQRELLFDTPDAGVSGSYQVQVTRGGCSALSNIVSVTISEELVTPQISSNAPICITDTLMLQVDNAPAGQMYNWYLMDGTSIATATEATTRIALADAAWATAGNIQIYAQAVAGTCISDTSNILNVLILNDATIAVSAGPDQTVCGTEALLIGNVVNGNAGTWSQVSGPTGFMNSALANDSLQLDGLTPGTYVFRYTIESADACSGNSDEVSLTVHPGSAVASANGPYNVCGGNLVTLNADLPDGFTGTWSTSDNITITNPQNPMTTVSGLVVGSEYTLTWALTSACGEVVSSDVVTLRSSNPTVRATINGSENIEICNTDGTINLSAQNDGVIGTWTVDDMDVMIEPIGAGDAMRASGLTDGTYTFTYEINNGSCGTTTDQVVVMLDQLPTLVDDVDSVDLGNLVRMDLLENDENTAFNFIESFDNTTNYGEIFQNTDGTLTYQSNGKVFTEDNFGYRVCSEICPTECVSGSATVVLRVDTDCVVPTIFTPNGDGVNDQFVISCVLAYPNNELMIFNEWGDEVYSAAPYNNDWEGTFEGNILPVGTYFFVFKKGNGDPAQTGFIRIER